MALAAPPSNDNFANAESLSGTRATASTTNAEATKEAGEPNHANNAGGRSVWYSWTASASGNVVIDTCNSSFDTLLGVYTGNTVGALTLVARNDDAGGACPVFTRSRVAFAATAGTTYRIAVDGFGAASGLVWLQIVQDAPPANDLFASAEELTGTQASAAVADTRRATKEAGEPDHAGNAGGRSVWYSWTAPATAEVIVDTCGSGINTLLAVYTGGEVGALTPVASNDDSNGCGNSGHSQVAFPADAGTTYKIAVDSWGGLPGNLKLHLEQGEPPANDPFASAEELAGPEASATGNTRFATKEAGEPEHAGNAGGRSVWYRWTAPSSGEVSIDTCLSGFNTVLAVYTGSEIGALTPVASNDDSNFCGGHSRVLFTVTAGTTYSIAVDMAGGRSGSVRLHLEQGMAPANDAFASAEELIGGAASATGDSRFASKEAGEPDHAGHAGGSSVWYRWTAPSSGPVIVDTCGSSFHTLLAVYTGSAVGALTPVASSLNSSGCATFGLSRVVFTATAGTTYRIAVDGFSGDRVGSMALHLEQGAAPVNDAFASARGLAGARTTTTANNRFATKEAGEPAHAGHIGGSSVWYRWTAPSSGPVVVDTCGSGFDTLLAVYTGSAVGALTPVASNNDSDVCSNANSQVEFTAIEGTSYRIAVDGLDGQGGAIALRVAMRSPELELSPSSLSFDAQAVGTSSSPRSITVTNSGDLPLFVFDAGLTGDHPTDFVKEADTCTGEFVAPAGTCTIQVRFTPGATGPRSAEVRIASNAPGSPSSVALSGTGAAPDGDGDGVPDDSDNCPDAANAGQADGDGDGIGDACDPRDDTDSDGDGVRDEADNCPQDANEGQADRDSDGMGDACDPRDDTDSDGDGVRNEADNCPDAANAGQADADEDGLGDACDPTPKPTPAGICALLSEYVQGSAKYKALPVKQQAAIKRTLDAICQTLARYTPRMSAKEKAALVKAAQAAVRGLASQGWLTDTGTAKLNRLIGRL